MLIVGCVTGCKSGDDGATKDGRTVISMWSANSHSKTVMEKLVDRYNNGDGKKDGIYFEYVVKEGDSLTKSLELALQTGQGPDIMPGLGSLPAMVENGYVVALTDLPGGEEFVKKYEGILIKDKNTYKGKVYGVPSAVTTMGLIYNKDMFKEAGIVDEKGEPVPPKTFSEVREVAKKLTDKSKNKFGIIFPQKWTGWVGSDITNPLLSSIGNTGFNPVTGEYDYTGIETIIDTYKGIIDDGSAYPGMEGIDNDMARAYFAQGSVGMKISWSFDVSVLNNQFPAECDWGVAPLPVIDADNCYLQYMKYSSSPYINAASVETKGGEKLLKVLKWLLQDDVRRELYENGVELPIDTSIIEGVDESKLPKGWADFAKLADISHAANLVPQSDMTGMLSLSERITQQVLSGKVSSKDMVKQYNADINAATKKYYENHTDEKFDEYLDPSWNIKR